MATTRKTTTRKKTTTRRRAAAPKKKASFRGRARTPGGSSGTGSLSNRIDPPSHVIRAGRVNYQYEDFKGGLLPVHPVLGRVVSTDDLTKGLATIEFEGNVANVEIQCHVLGNLVIRNNDPVLVVFYTDQPNSGVVLGTLERGPGQMTLTTTGIGTRHSWTIDARSDQLIIERNGTDLFTINNAGKHFLAGALRITGLPTSSAGLSSGDVWRNGNVLNIV